MTAGTEKKTQQRFGGLPSLLNAFFLAATVGAFAAGSACAAKPQPNPEDEAPKIVRGGANETLQEKPQAEVAKDKVFHKPTVVIKKKKPEEIEKPKEEYKYKFPSLSFLTSYDPWKLRVVDMTLLQDNLAVLVKRHPDCRIIESKWDKDSPEGMAACSNTAVFLAEGEEVIFTFSRANEVLTGASFKFSSRQRAERFAERIVNTLQLRQPTFKESYDEKSYLIDSPMFSVDTHPAQSGWLVKVAGHFTDRFEDSETYAKAKLQKMEFGELTIGETKLEELPSNEELPKACKNVTSGKDELKREYYGLCFGFPYEAHMQFNFSPSTNILQTVVLSPIGVSSGGIVDDMLSKKHGLSQICRRLNSDVEIGKIKSEPFRGAYQERLLRMRGRTVSLYAGTCRNPLIYSTDMRFVFENRFLEEREIMADYERRRSLHEVSTSHQEAFDRRRAKLNGFFE